MTIEEASEGLGRIVIYDPGHGGKREEGTLVAVGPGGARVRYSHNDASIKVTPLDRLTFL